MSTSEIPQYDLNGELIEEAPFTPSVEDHTPEEDSVVSTEEHEGVFDWDTHLEALNGETVSIEDVNKQMAVFSEAAIQLRNLEYTVSKEGVSKEDVRTLMSLQHTLAEQGVDFTGVSLEDYTAGFFTEERSSVSITIAQESFMDTMVRTVKEWIKKLVAFIGRMIDWAVSNITGEAMYARNLKRSIDAFGRARDVRVKAEVLANTRNATKPIMTNYARELLGNERLRVNFATIAVFSSPASIKKMEKNNEDAVYAAKDLTKNIDKLKNDLGNLRGVITFSGKPTYDIMNLAKESLAFVEPDASKRDLTGVVKPDVFERDILEQVGKVTPFEDIVKEYGEMRKKLKMITKVNNKEKIKELTEYLNAINTTITELGNILSVAKQINDIKLQVIGLYVNYENHYINNILRITREDIKDNGVSDRITRMVNEVRESILKSA